MSVGLGQILIIIIVGLVLFGKFPGLSKDLLSGLNNLQNILRYKQKNDSENSDESTKTKSIEDTSVKSVDQESKLSKK